MATKKPPEEHPEQPIRVPRCFNCFYFRDPECRRWAPQANFEMDTQSRRARARLTWPEVGIDDWCGEYVEAGDPVDSSP